MDEKNINIIALGGGILLTSLGLYFVTKSVLNQIKAKAEDKLEDIMYYPDEVNGIINKLTDEELKKLATYYKGATKGTSLYAQMNDEWNDITNTSFYATSIKRLASLGLR